MECEGKGGVEHDCKGFDLSKLKNVVVNFSGEECGLHRLEEGSCRIHFWTS